MKKILTILLLLMLCITLFACSEAQTTPNGGDGSESSTQAEVNAGDTHEVVFMSDDKTVHITQNVNDGAKAEKPFRPTKADGYVFEKWVYEDGTEYDFSAPVKSDLTLYAVFYRTFTVQYYGQDGKVVYTETVREGNSSEYTDTPATYETDYQIYTFDKWVTEKDGSIEADLSSITADINVYAAFNSAFKPDVKPYDFEVVVEEGREVRILQLTDTQVIDYSGKRYDGRTSGTEVMTDEIFDKKVAKYIRETVAQADPDLILLTGDIVYGEFDDEGKWFLKMIETMESLNIPWAPIFGNHDNESMMGVAWQCEQLEAAQNCLFKRGDLTGNGNYSIGIKQGDKLVKVVYMLDSNGCGAAYRYTNSDTNQVVYINQDEKENGVETVKTSAGFGSDQLNWLKETAELIDELYDYPVSKFIAFHIPISEFADAAYASGYQSNASTGNDELYTIGTTVVAQNGDFGSKGEAFKGAHVEKGLWEILKNCNFDGVFVGHSHKNNVSMLYDGIRLTFGLKTGICERYTDGQTGGTLITVNEGGEGFAVRHIYVN